MGHEEDGDDEFGDDDDDNPDNDGRQRVKIRRSKFIVSTNQFKLSLWVNVQPLKIDIAFAMTSRFNKKDSAS